MYKNNQCDLNFQIYLIMRKPLYDKITNVISPQLEKDIAARSWLRLNDSPLYNSLITGTKNIIYKRINEFNKTI